MLEPRLDVPGPWIAAGTDSDLWRGFRTEFEQLHAAELVALTGQREDRRYRVLGTFGNPQLPFGDWKFFSCIDDRLSSKFIETATRIGVLLHAPSQTNPVDYWLYSVFRILRAYDLAGLQVTNHSGGFISDILDSSAICCTYFATEVDQYNYGLSRSADDRTIPGESLTPALIAASAPLVTAEILQSPVEKSWEPSGGYEGKPTCWRDVGLRFTSEHRVQISINGIVGESYGYADLGFEDKRTGKPNQAWGALYKLAEKQGRYDVTKMGGRPRAHLEKRFQEIRNRLCNHFKVGGDPVPFEKGNGYQAAFGILVSPAIIFEAPKIRRTL